MGKRVSWVELYLDLIFVLAIGQLAHLIVGDADPPRMAYWLACVGIGIYLAGTRVFLLATSRVPGVVRALLLIATFQLGRLEPELSPHGYLWLLTAWVVMCAALSTRTSRGDDSAELERYLGGRRAVR